MAEVRDSEAKPVLATSRSAAADETLIARDDRSVEDKLRSIAAVILSEHRVRPEWVTVLILEIQRSQRFSAEDRMRRVGELFRLVEEILRDGQGKGELRKHAELFVNGMSSPGPVAIG